MTNVKNQYHIEIKKGCCSCQYKQIGYDGTRNCSQTAQEVESGFCCDLWQISDGLNEAGKAKGTVRKLTEIIID